MSIAYLAALLLSTGCMLLIDFRYRLFLFRSPAAAGLVILLGTVFFLLWDAAGIALGIFLVGDSPYMTGIMLGPEMPLEEPVFLIFLVICTMVLYTGAHRLLHRRTAQAGTEPSGSPARGSAS
ncbi:lycopene cyclase domain-containing protein [Nesterenkonia aerolata]|uniref:Lycopene cyclase domain-containing protein n=1 Tax=Nesterenkonia aerolata TaxID=3074079 RepID=A0ABU2DV51_9MICC|nr:lycopene cyclase domain-containing protein [Nesterenkonia sp. LY-0111]MDR8020384.1 lycopene cyclase domain-containing protein [Nesterenkonia sp. LY-0111]